MSVRYIDLFKIRENQARLFYFCAGFCPLTAIAGFIFGIMPLSLSALFVVLPMYLLMFVVGRRFPRVARAALSGWIAGVVAVVLYDLSRVPFMLAG